MICRLGPVTVGALAQPPATPRPPRRRPARGVRGGLRCPTIRPRTGWKPINRASATHQSMLSRHDCGCASSHAVGLSASRPGTMSSSWPRCTSTIEVHQLRVRHRPWRPNRVSSRPNASTAPTRALSAASSASPQASTARFAVCQSQPNSAATSATGRASRPTAIVAQRPARAVNAPRAGAIRSSASVNDPTTQLAAGQRQRHLCQTRRTGRPNAGRPTSFTTAAPLDHTAPPQPPHAGRPRVRMCSANGPPGASSTPRTSTSTRPISSNSQIRVGFSSTGGLQYRNWCLSTPILEAPNPPIADPVPAHFRRASNPPPNQSSRSSPLIIASQCPRIIESLRVEQKDSSIWTTHAVSTRVNCWRDCYNRYEGKHHFVEIRMREIQRFCDLRQSDSVSCQVPKGLW